MTGGEDMMVFEQRLAARQQTRALGFTLEQGVFLSVGEETWWGRVQQATVAGVWLHDAEQRTGGQRYDYAAPLFFPFAAITFIQLDPEDQGP